VLQVLHPPTAGSPGHAHWQAVSTQAAGLLSLRVSDKADAFIDRLNLFKIGWSWGGPISLAVPYELGEIRQAGQGAVIRLAIGLEDPSDLIDDLRQAAERLHGRA
jgi:cystathionine beta-lyase